MVISIFETHTYVQTAHGMLFICRQFHMWQRQNSEIVCKNYDIQKIHININYYCCYYYYYFLQHHCHYVTCILTQLGYERTRQSHKCVS